MRLIDADGKQLGVVSIQEALRLSEERELDLVEVSPQTSPPVCKILDFGKFKYAQNKKDREAHKKRKNQQLKEVKLRTKIDPHDFATKSKLVSRLLQEGDKVKVTIVFRGREITYTQLGQQILEKMASEAATVGLVERFPRLEGRAMIMILSPKGGHSDAKNENQALGRQADQSDRKRQTDAPKAV